MVLDATNRPKRQNSIDAAGTPSENSWKNGKKQLRKETLTFSVRHQAPKMPPVGSEIQHNLESYDVTATTADVKMEDSDEKSTSDEELPCVEPKPHSKTKLRNQHKQLSIMDKLELPTDLKEEHASK